MPITKPDNSEIARHLSSLGKIHYWPNLGNFGDLLIAEGTRAFFREFHIEYEEYDPENPPESCNLVYAGGGRFTPHWGGIEYFMRHMTNPRVKNGVILPHSITGVDHFVTALDERWTVYCREQRCYDYCRGLNSRAHFIKAHDMALQLNKSYILGKGDEAKAPGENASTEEKDVYKLLQNGFADFLRQSVHQSSTCLRLGGQKKQIAFLLRKDPEKSGGFDTKNCFDISNSWNSSGKAMAYNRLMLNILAHSLDSVDCVVTDRLHVSILAAFLNKDVYMMDNDYGKLKGVYDYSLKSCQELHYIGSTMPADIDKAWKQLNSPCRIALLRFLRTYRKLLRRLRISR